MKIEGSISSSFSNSPERKQIHFQIDYTITLIEFIYGLLPNPSRSIVGISIVILKYKQINSLGVELAIKCELK